MRSLINGTLYDAPQARTSKSGKPYATAKVKADAKDGAVLWCSIVAFGDTADALLQLAANTPVAVCGKAELRAYLDKAGEPAAGLSVVADELIALKPKPKPKPTTAAAGFDDAL